MKKYYTSKTMWFALFTFAFGGLEAVKPIVPVEWLPYIVVGMGLLTALLRSVTNQSVTLGGGHDAE